MLSEDLWLMRKQMKGVAGVRIYMCLYSNRVIRPAFWLG